MNYSLLYPTEIARWLCSLIPPFVAALMGLLASPCRSETAVAAPNADPRYTVIHAFTNDRRGNHPRSALIEGPDGDLYGSAYMSGSGTYGNPNFGSIYKTTANGTTTPLHTFVGSDGSAPSAGLALGSDGQFYGEAGGGGAYGGGTVFKLSPSGDFKLLHSFDGPANDGAFPYLGALVEGSDHAFYGTTMQRGAFGFGTAFRMTPEGDVTVLHAFARGKTDGAYPRGQLMRASDGSFYGTTLCGGAREAAGACSGTIYRIGPTGDFELVFSFDSDRGPEGGYQPQATLTERNGTLYGTTTRGGRFDAGTVFKFGLSHRLLSIVHHFDGAAQSDPPGSDGRWPVATLLLATDGSLYGTTGNGGSFRTVNPDGDGVIFRIDAADTFSLVRSFGINGKDGSNPVGALFQARNGILYGTAESGGTELDGVIYTLNAPTLVAEPVRRP